MRTVFEEEEEEAASAGDRRDAGQGAEQDRELTISSTTLLAIFFGLVLICGLFFGLGYTFGRRTPADAQLAAAASSPSEIQPAAITSKPSAASQPATQAPIDPQPADASSDADSASESTPEKTPEVAATPAPPVVKPALPPAMQTALAPAATSSALTSAPAGIPAGVPTGIMVQIAAISNPADADVLVSALQKHGYTVAARRFSGDPLIHVQVGPFQTRAEAIAMRQKLLGDGYNAILK